jgi:predicted O-methyltransferase YrrM
MTKSAPPIVQDVFPESRTSDDAFIRDGMSPVELSKLGALIRQERPARILEIGMANGTSSVVIADAMGTGHLTSIDPHQTMPKPRGYESAGVRAVARLTTEHRIIEEFDYLALPHLIDEGATFDFILIDGFHSFDLTLLDLFYADKLLKVGGSLACHDSSSPPVYKALRWLEANKPYERLSPSLYTAELPIWTKLYDRLLRRAERFERQNHWQMLVAYRKQAMHDMAEHQLVDF